MPRWRVPPNPTALRHPWAVDNADLAASYWEYYRLAFSEDRQDRLVAERTRDVAGEVVNDAALENAPGVVPLLLTLAEAAPDDAALAYLGAGPIEDLLAHHALDVVDEIDEQAQRHEKFRYALRCAWFDDKLPEQAAKRLRRFGPAP